MPTENVQLAARCEEANDFMDDLKRYGGTVSHGLHEQVVVALEYLRSNADLAREEGRS